MENNWQKKISIVSWISWHEYQIAGIPKTLIYDQRSRVYYLLLEEVSDIWRHLCAGSISDSKFIVLLRLLIEDGIIILNKEIEGNDEIIVKTHDVKITKHKCIPDYFNEELRSEGYIFDAHWDITNRCNAKCIHCYNLNAHNGLRNLKADELSFEEAKALVDELLYLGVFRLVLSGGEVLTSPFFLLLCQYIRKHNIQLIIYTNGIAFTEKILHDLVILAPSVVCFSIYGNNSNVHDNITKMKGSYQKILKALAYLNKHHIETCHKNTILAENYRYWKDTLEKGKKLSDRSLLNCTIYPGKTGSDWDRAPEVTGTLLMRQS